MVSTCILHFIVQVKCINSEALQRSVQSGGGTSTRCPPASYPPAVDYIKDTSLKMIGLDEAPSKGLQAHQQDAHPRFFHRHGLYLAQ